MLSHERAVERIGRYLLGTKNKGIVFRSDEVVDAGFVGGWSKEEPDNPENILSRTGFVVFYV